MALKHFAVVATVAVAGTMASAETVTSLIGNTSQPETMFTQASSAKGVQYWSDGQAPHSDADYSVSNLMGPAYVENSTTNHLFVGKSCSVKHFSLYSHLPNEVTFAQNGLILENSNDGMRDRNQTTHTYLINGKVKVNGNNVRIRKTSVENTKNNRVTYRFSGDFSCKDASSILYMPDYNSLPGLETIRFEGSTDNYVGMIDINASLGVNWLEFANENQVFPGTVKMSQDARLNVYSRTAYLGTLNASTSGSELTLAPSNDFTVATAELSGDLKVTTTYDVGLHRCGSLTVTNLTAGGTLSVDIGVANRTIAAMTNYTGEAVVLRVPADFDADKVKINLADVPFTSDHAVFPRLSVVEATEGEWRTYAVFEREMVFQTAAVPPNANLPTEGSCWSDGLAPHANAVYWSKNFTFTTYPDGGEADMSGFDFVFQTTVNADTQLFKAKTITFLATDCELCGYRNGTSAQVEVYPGWKFKMYQGFVADFFIVPYNGTKSRRFRAYEDRFLHFKGELTGGGLVSVLTRGYAETYKINTHGGYVYFDGVNTNFTGKITTGRYQPFHTDVQLGSLEGTKIVFSRKENLGGPFSEFAFDALYLKDYNSLYPIDNVTLDDLTRGIRFGDHSYVITDKSVKLTLKQALTFGGVLQKEGTGILELAAAENEAVQFIDSARTTVPVADKNVLNVVDGGLEVTSKWAADGLAIAFSGNGKLVVKEGSTVDTALYDVKAGGSLTAEGGAIPLGFDVTPETAEDRAAFTATICTVPKGSNLSFTLAAKPYPGARLNVTRTENGDCETYTAEVSRTGLMLLVK